jgi:hypothetical protein
MTVRPKWDPATVEWVLLEGNFVGFKRYPDVTVIIAHFGRSFCPYYLKEGLIKYCTDPTCR